MDKHGSIVIKIVELYLFIDLLVCNINSSQRNIHVSCYWWHIFKTNEKQCNNFIKISFLCQYIEQLKNLSTCKFVLMEFLHKLINHINMTTSSCCCLGSNPFRTILWTFFGFHGPQHTHHTFKFPNTQTFWDITKWITTFHLHFHISLPHETF